MRVFVTGATGYVGGAVTRRLVADHEVLAMVRSPEAADAVSRLGATPVRCDLATVDETHLATVEAVVHCAAEVSDWAPAGVFEAVNLTGTERLLAAARSAQVGRFVHMSSDSVLFDGRDVVDVDEDTPTPDHSRYRYADSKRRAERAVLDANGPGFETLAVRPVLVWGPGDRTILPIVLDMLDRKAFVWVGGGRNRVSTTHIDNVAEGTVLALERGRPGGVYFLTDGPPVEFRSFLTEYVATAGRDISATSIPAPLIRAAGRLVEGLWSIVTPGRRPPLTAEAAAVLAATITVDSDRATRELGYTPVVTREAAMAALAAAGRQ